MRKFISLTLLIAVTLFSCTKNSSTTPPTTTTNPPTETIATLSPTAFAGGANQASTDGTGTTAQFYQIIKLTIDKLGNIYVLEAVNTSTNLFYKIRKITASGVTSTLFNGGSETFTNNVPIEKTKVYRVIDITSDPNGNLYVLANMSDYSMGNAPGYYQEYGTYKLNPTTNTLDKISVSSAIQTGSGLTSWVAAYNLLNNIAVDASGNLYGAYSPGNITGIPSGGKVYKVTTGTGSLYATADAAYPSTLVGDANGILYASTPTGILKVTSSGAASVFTFPASVTAVNPYLVGSQSGTLYVYGELLSSSKEYKGVGFYKVGTDGTVTNKGIIANAPNLFGVVTDASGNIFYAVHLSTGGYTIYKVTLN